MVFVGTTSPSGISRLSGFDPQPGKEEEDPFSVQIGASTAQTAASYVAGLISDELYNGCALCASEFRSHTRKYAIDPKPRPRLADSPPSPAAVTGRAGFPRPGAYLGVCLA